MAASLSQTLIRKISSSYSPHRFLKYTALSRSYSGYPDFSTLSDGDAAPSSPAEATAVRIIEDAVHRVIMSRSEPDWLPFVPGASYWVPPKRRNFGVAELLRTLSNTNTHLGNVDHEVLVALIASRGWPSSSYYLEQNGGSSSDSEQAEAEEVSSGVFTSMDDIVD